MDRRQSVQQNFPKRKSDYLDSFDLFNKSLEIKYGWNFDLNKSKKLWNPQVEINKDLDLYPSIKKPVTRVT